MAARFWRFGVATALALGLVGPADARAADEAQPAAEADAGMQPEVMLDYLMAEFAAQRGDTLGALAIYHRLARELKDPLIARRAVETAIRARAFGPALESATLLLELDPESALAREIMATLLANEADLSKARATLAQILEKSANREALLMETNAALALRPSWQQGAILKAQILRKEAPGDVVAFYREFVSRNPDAQDVRMQLGRELAADHKLGEARDQFREAEKRAQSDPQAAYATGLLSLQLEDYAEAQQAFSRALKQGYREPTSIYLGMGQAAEGLKHYEEAIGWYQKVDSAEWVRAQLKIATLIARQQGLAAGRDYVRRIEPRSAEDRIQMIQVEAQLLREAKEWQETYKMLTKAVADYPDSFELLYDRAMSAERVEKLDVLEADLRRVIKMKPDYAHAYNALGYTLAEKTNRLVEAKQLIDTAYKLSPDDPFILDSLGWVYYRLGEVQEALKHLQTAYTARPDPEIAAHLGEVLWKSGQRDEAQKIWRAALTENPNHESLLAVMAKYRQP